MSSPPSPTQQPLALLNAILPVLLSCMPMVAVGCGSEDSSFSAPAGQDAGQDATGEDSAAAIDVAAPDAPEDAAMDSANDTAEEDLTDNDAPTVDGPSCTAVVQSVQGSTVGKQGEPLAGIVGVLCVYLPNGSASCLDPVKSNSAGIFTFQVPSSKQCLDRAAYHLLSGDDWTLSSVYCPVDLGAGGNVVIPVPDRLVHAPAPVRDPLGDPTAPHVISEPGGARLTVIPADLLLFDFAYDDIRMLTWDASAWGWPCFVDPASPPDALVAFVPEVEVASHDAAHIAFPNTASLAPGTVVQVWGLGGAASMRWDGTELEEGSFEVIGEAVVSGDGAWIETRPGEGLPFMTWVGWKKT